MSFATQLFKQKPSDRIIRIVCRKEKVPLNKVLSKDRHRKYCLTRQIIFHILRHKYKYTFAYIAKIFNKDHATVFHGCKAIDNLLETDKQFVEKMKGIVDYVTRNVKKRKLDHSPSEYSFAKFA